MAEALKKVYDSKYIDELSNSFAGVYPSFKRRRFRELVFSAKWEELELKQRCSRICESIHKVLDLPFEEVCDILKLVGRNFRGYAALYFPEYIQRYGLNEESWDTSLNSLEVLTQYSSAEFAIRAFIELSPERAMRAMLKWSKSENEHIRRLSCEGCRPRLPWAKALVRFKKDPTIILPILENLKDDSSLYVRKSVANNLNDISKDHPMLALSIAKKWMQEPSKESMWIIKHGLRTLLKSSNQDALNLFELGDTSSVEFSNFKLLTPLVHMGERLSFQFDLGVNKRTKLRIEYALYFKKKRGDYGRKVFKLSEVEVEAGEYEVTKEHLFKEMTTRTFNQGVHFLEIIVNGRVFTKNSFYLNLKEKGKYYIYMIYTLKGTIYTGITTEPKRRFMEHQEGKKGAKYTKANKPVCFIHLEVAESRSVAQKREFAIKKLSRKEKVKISATNLMILKD